MVNPLHHDDRPRHTPRVTYAFDLANNHYHLSLLYTGLARLAASREIDLDWRLEPGHEADSTPTGGMVARLIVDHESRRERLAIDLFDRSDVFHPETLSWCDRYLKRSCYTPETLAHAGEHAKKVEPFGMNYACRSPEADRLVTRSVLRQAAARGFRSPRRLAGQLLGQRNQFRTYWSLPMAEDFEAPPEAPREDRVLFQTRVWDPEDVLPDDPEEINGTRVAVVRALRKEFGARFLGGLVPTPYAKRYYPDLITTASTRRRDFIRLVKTSKVLVYTRGLHHSIAFKLPEYLAASGVIVSEPVRNELPESAASEFPFAIASTPAAIASCVVERFEDREFEAGSRQAAFDRYQTSISPSETISRTIKLQHNAQEVIRTKPAALAN